MSVDRNFGTKMLEVDFRKVYSKLVFRPINDWNNRYDVNRTNCDAYQITRRQ